MARRKRSTNPPEPAGNGEPAADAAARSPKGAKDGRDAAGRFLKGQWRGGPGNPFARQVAELRRAIFATVTPAHVQQVFTSLLNRATKHGDVTAAALLLKYAVPVPQPVDDDADDDPDAEAGLDQDQEELLATTA
jgi:hypothetical protein